MAEENQEIVAAILAAGIMANSGGHNHVTGHVVQDTDTIVSLYHSCLTKLQRPTQEDRPS